MDKNLLKRYERDLALKGYTKQTQKAYCRCVKNFLEQAKKPATKISREDIKDYLYHIIKDKEQSESSLKQARGAIKYFFMQTMNLPIEVEFIPYHKKAKRLPSVFSIEEVVKIIKAASNMKHAAMLMLAYSSGLRVSELAAVKVTDICRNIMRLLVRQGKGRQDRYTVLSKICLIYLEKYWKQYRPDEWLFSGRQDSHISTRAIQHAYLNAKKNAGITKEGGIHTLRHSFATHLLEYGGGIFQLQKFLGHKHLSTTLVYAHICEEKIEAPSPLDVYVDRLNGTASVH